MTPIADMVARLIAAGTPPELAAMVVTEAFAAGASCGHSADKVDVAAERRREKDRERKRELRRQSAESADIPQNSNSALSSFSSQQIQDSKEGKKKGRGTTLSADWNPSAGHFDEGSALGLRDDDVRGMAADMRLWAWANSNRAVARKSNWDMTFSAWMRREAGKRKPTNTKSGIIDAADRALESLRQSEREATERGSGISSAPAFRLIS